MAAEQHPICRQAARLPPSSVTEAFLTQRNHLLLPRVNVRDHLLFSSAGSAGSPEKDFSPLRPISRLEMKAGAGSLPQLPHSQAIASTEAGCHVGRTSPRLDDPKGSTLFVLTNSPLLRSLSSAKRNAKDTACFALCETIPVEATGNIPQPPNPALRARAPPNSVCFQLVLTEWRRAVAVQTYCSGLRRAETKL